MSPKTSITDLGGYRERDAIERCRSGDVEGLATLYDLFSQRVFRTCFRILGEQGAAEDLTQEIFIGLLGKLRSFRHQSKFSTWLYRVATNQALNAVRARSRRHARFFQMPFGSSADDWRDGEPSPAERVLTQESYDRVQRLLADLKPDHRAALVLREIEGLSYQEIAEVLSVPIGTVMSRLSRARQVLRARWDDQRERNSSARGGVQNEERSSRP